MLCLVKEPAVMCQIGWRLLLKQNLCVPWQISTKNKQLFGIKTLRSLYGWTQLSCCFSVSWLFHHSSILPFFHNRTFKADMEPLPEYELHGHSALTGRSTLHVPSKFMNLCDVSYCCLHCVRKQHKALQTIVNNKCLYPMSEVCLDQACPKSGPFKFSPVLEKFGQPWFRLKWLTSLN